MKHIFASFTRSKMSMLLLICAVSLVVSDPALATGTIATADTGAGGVARGIFNQLGSFADVAYASSFMIGIFIGILSLMKFKAYNEDSRQTKISTPIILALVAGALIGYPSYLTMSKDTILSGGANSSMNQGDYKNIGG